MNENTFCEWINFYNLCVFIRYSQANAIKWPEPISYATTGGGTIPKRNVTSTEQAQIFYMEGGLKSKRRVYEWICLIKPTQYWQWQNVCFFFRFFFSGTEADVHMHPPLRTYVHTNAASYTHTRTHAHVVLPSTAKGSNENKWQSSIPAGNQGGT